MNDASEWNKAFWECDINDQSEEIIQEESAFYYAGYSKNILKWILDKKLRDRMIREKKHFSRKQRLVFMENGALSDRRNEQL